MNIEAITSATPPIPLHVFVAFSAVLIGGIQLAMPKHNQNS